MQVQQQQQGQQQILRCAKDDRQKSNGKCNGKCKGNGNSKGNGKCKGKCKGNSNSGSCAARRMTDKKAGMKDPSRYWELLTTVAVLLVWVSTLNRW